MQKHAMALGYFFLSVFCIVTSPHTVFELRLPLLLAGLMAGLAGFVFLGSACAMQLQTGKKWLTQMVRLAQRPPEQHSNLRDEHTV